MIGMNALKEWVDLVCRELEIAVVVSPRPCSPGAGRSNDPEATAEEFAARLCLLAQRWGQDHQ
jgi:hypothetical protein